MIETCEFLILVEMHGPLAVFNDVVLEDLDCLGLSLFKTILLSLVYHSHVKSDISVQSKHYQSFIAVT